MKSSISLEYYIAEYDLLFPYLRCLLRPFEHRTWLHCLFLFCDHIFKLGIFICCEVGAHIIDLVCCSLWRGCFPSTCHPAPPCGSSLSLLLSSCCGCCSTLLWLHLEHKLDESQVLETQRQGYHLPSPPDKYLYESGHVYQNWRAGKLYLDVYWGRHRINCAQQVHAAVQNY